MVTCQVKLSLFIFQTNFQGLVAFSLFFPIFQTHFQGLVAFSLGMVALVFWTLTFLQCPLTPSHYRGERKIDQCFHIPTFCICWTTFTISLSEQIRDQRINFICSCSTLRNLFYVSFSSTASTAFSHFFLRLP